MECLFYYLTGVCICVCAQTSNTKVNSGMNVSFAVLSENVCSFFDVQVCHSVLLRNATSQPCSVNGYISVSFSPAAHSA